MKLIPIISASQKQSQTFVKMKLICCNCNQKTLNTEGFADIEGKAFQDYYCPTCADKIIKSGVT